MRFLVENRKRPRDDEDEDEGEDDEDDEEKFYDLPEDAFVDDSDPFDEEIVHPQSLFESEDEDEDEGEDDEDDEEKVYDLPEDGFVDDSVSFDEEIVYPQSLFQENDEDEDEKDEPRVAEINREIRLPPIPCRRRRCQRHRHRRQCLSGSSNTSRLRPLRASVRR